MPLWSSFLFRLKTTSEANVQNPSRTPNHLLFPRLDDVLHPCFSQFKGCQTQRSQFAGSYDKDGRAPGRLPYVLMCHPRVPTCSPMPSSSFKVDLLVREDARTPPDCYLEPQVTSLFFLSSLSLV